MSPEEGVEESSLGGGAPGREGQGQESVGGLGRACDACDGEGDAVAGSGLLQTGGEDAELLGGHDLFVESAFVACWIWC